MGFSDDVWHSAEDSPIISMVDPLAPVAFRLGVVVAGLVLERILTALNK